MKDKVVFITGGAGTLGQEVTRQLLQEDVREIRIFSRSEFQQVEMKNKFNNDRLKFIIGDIRDKDAVTNAMRWSDYVIHLAAMKHVGICENQPDEAIKTNIDGTRNVINAANETLVSKFVNMSTDKAILPSNVYGMTKGICEKLILQANQLTDDCSFCNVRSGNILGSSGSVWPLFKKMANEKNQITVTDSRMTRFFLPVWEIAEVIVFALKNTIGGETFIPKMKPFDITDLASIALEIYGKKGDIIDTYSRGNEKITEILYADYERDNVYDIDDCLVIIPEGDDYWIKNGIWYPGEEDEIGGTREELKKMVLDIEMGIK